MPVVLTEVGGIARSGHEYGDRTGIEYEYPRGRYEKWIQPGVQFVYQVPKTGYTGSGVIGSIRPSEDPERLICDVLSVSLFEQAVPLKNSAGTYFEADPSFWKDKVYWGQGVRPLSDSRFGAIVRSGGVRNDFVQEAAGSYTSPAVARAVEDYSVAVVVEQLQHEFGDVVTVMPRNNPGFDLRVGPEDNPIRFVEVKGTQAANSTFFMSDGERRFSIANADRYTLFVVSAINLMERTHATVARRDGAVDGDDFDLRPNQWRGHLLTPA